MTDYSRNFSDEEMARDWTLSPADLKQLSSCWKSYRLYVAIQICSLRYQGRFTRSVDMISSRIVNYLNKQLQFPPSLGVEEPEREATWLSYRKMIMTYLGFRKYDSDTEEGFTKWLTRKSSDGMLPKALRPLSEGYLLAEKIILPSSSELNRKINRVCAQTHSKIFETIQQRIPEELKQSIERLLIVPEGDQYSFFNLLKESPPSARISSLCEYLKRYQRLAEIDLDQFQASFLSPDFLQYIFDLSRSYNATQMRRFKSSKRFALLICFLIESRRLLLDYLIEMHDQYIMTICRKTRNNHEKKYRASRRQQKNAIDVMLKASDLWLNWQRDAPLLRDDFFQHIGKQKMKNSSKALKYFKYLEERGYADGLVAYYASLRKYFPDFLCLPFAVEEGSEKLFHAIEIIRQLDRGELKNLPQKTPTSFTPKDLRYALRYGGNLNRNVWEMGVAIALKDALRSGDIYVPQSKEHISFWNMMAEESECNDSTYQELDKPSKSEIKARLIEDFNTDVFKAENLFGKDGFARIINGKLKLKRDDKIILPPSVKQLQQGIDASMPPIRIERLLMEVDQATGFSKYFIPISDHKSRPENFYKTLIASIISQATNLGIVAMSSSVKGISVDMLRHALHHYVRPDTINAANAEIVNAHHKLPISSIHGSGEISSSDAQRFRIRADRLF